MTPFNCWHKNTHNLIVALHLSLSQIHSTPLFIIMGDVMALFDRLALMKSTTDRIASLFDSENLSDVVFIVGNDSNSCRYPAHKFILSLASPVFRTMFASQLAEAKDGAKIQITDIQPTAFESVMRYIYTNELRLDSVRVTLDILYTAHKYMLYHLTTMCMTYLAEHISWENVLEVYQEIKLYDVELNKGQVMLKCLQTIDKDASEVLQSQAFGNLDINTVKLILAREFLHVSSESVVFNALAYWSVQECRRRKLELSNENRRRVLGKALNLIQYLAMSRQEFLEGPSTSGLLTEDECQALLARIYGDESMPLPIHLRRRQLKWKRNLYICYPVKFYRNEPNLFPSQKQEESLLVVTNQDIILLGFDLYGPTNPNEVTTEKTKTEDDEAVTENVTVKCYTGALHLIVSDMFGNEMGSIQWKSEHIQPLKDTKLYVGFTDGVFLKSRKKYKVQLYLPKGEYMMGENWEGTTTSKYKCRSIDFAVKYCRKEDSEGDASDDESFAELDSGSDDDTNAMVSIGSTEKSNAVVQDHSAMPDSQEAFIQSLFSGVKFYF